MEKKPKFPREMLHFLSQYGKMNKRSPLQAMEEPVTEMPHFLHQDPANSLPHLFFILSHRHDVLCLPPAPFPGEKGWLPKPDP